MPKKAKRQQNVKNSKFTFSQYKHAILIFVSIAVVVVIAGYFGIHSLIPVNGNTPAFAPPINTFMKASAFSSIGLAVHQPIYRRFTK